MDLLDEIQIDDDLDQEVLEYVRLFPGEYDSSDLACEIGRSTVDVLMALSRNMRRGLVILVQLSPGVYRWTDQ